MMWLLLAAYVAIGVVLAGAVYGLEGGRSPDLDFAVCVGMLWPVSILAIIGIAIGMKLKK